MVALEVAATHAATDPRLVHVLVAMVVDLFVQQCVEAAHDHPFLARLVLSPRCLFSGAKIRCQSISFIPQMSSPFIPSVLSPGARNPRSDTKTLTVCRSPRSRRSCIWHHMWWSLRWHWHRRWFHFPSQQRHSHLNVKQHC